MLQSIHFKSYSLFHIPVYSATPPRTSNPEEADEPSYAPELQPVAREGDRPGREQERGSRAIALVCGQYVGQISPCTVRLGAMYI